MKRTSIPAIGVVLVFAGSVAAESASHMPDANALHLRTGIVDTRLAPFRPAAAARAGDGASTRYVIQLDGPLTPARQAALSDAGVQLGPYLPMHAYIVRLDEFAADAAANLPFVQWVGPFLPDWKLDPSLRADQLAKRRAPLAAPESVQAVVCLFSDADVEAVVRQLSGIGAAIVCAENRGGRPVVNAVVPTDRLAELTLLPDVRYIEPQYEIGPRNDSSTWIVQSNVAGVRSIWDEGLHGEGEVAGVIDTGLDFDHCSFADTVAPGPTHRKIIEYYGAVSTASHGTHICGTLAGDQPTYDAYDTNDGVAYAAVMAFSRLSEISGGGAVTTLYGRLSDFHNTHGARVHSNSWGEFVGTYTALSVDADAFSRDFEESMVVFAIANGGTVLAPENAKNVLAVSGSKDTPNQHQHGVGATGPTFDGRRKPEVCAPGVNTFSSQALTACNFVADTGTSTACPAVAGAGILTRQYFTEGFYPSGTATLGDELTPTGALMRAILINSAVNMTGVTGYPSNLEGWGRVLLDDALYFAGDTRNLFLDDVRNLDGLSTDDETAYIVEVTDPSEPLKITLVWTDPPALEGTAFAPINDLDLVVISPTGDTYLGNVFNTTTGQSQTGGSADPINNIEQVHRLTPTTGFYQVLVTATAVNQDTQGYALVATGGLGAGGLAPLFESAASCNTHPGAGEGCNAFGADASVNIEPRQKGVTRLRIQTTQDIEAATVIASNVQIDCAVSGSYAGVVSPTLVGPRDILIDLSPAVPDLDCCTLTLAGVTTTEGLPLIDATRFRTVKGDVNLDGMVTTSDASQIKPFFNDPVDGTNFNFDFNVDGFITTSDFSQIKPLFNNTPPACL